MEMTQKKIQDPARTGTQHLLIPSQTPLPLSRSNLGGSGVLDIKVSIGTGSKVQTFCRSIHEFPILAVVGLWKKVKVFTAKFLFNNTSTK